MVTSKKGLDLIKKYEGLRLEAYVCPAGVLTIGYGHTGNVNGKKIQKGMKITDKMAEQLLMKDLATFEKGVADCVKVPLTQSQFDALVSFSYNLGTGSLRSSTLLKLLNQKKYEDAAKQFPLWVKAGGVTLQGLVKRREEEKVLFCSEKAPVKKKKSENSKSAKPSKAVQSGKPSNMIEHYTTKNRVQGLGISKPQFVVIHSTGNTASAKNENANTVNNDNKGIGAHYSVDAKEIYHTLQDDRKIYHCGTGGYYKQKHSLCRNANSVGIEMCQVDKKGTVAPETIQNTAKLVKYLMKKYSIPKENVIRHYDVVSKECPIAFSGTSEKNKAWEKLKKILVG